MNFAQALTLPNLRFIFDGLLVTLEVAVISIIFSFIIGGILGVIRFLRIPYLSKIVGLIIDIIRNLPLLLIIFFTYFALPQIGIQFSIFWSAVVALTIFESAMLSEIIRGGIEAVPKGQMEAGRSTGLNIAQTMYYIVLPQGIKLMVPPLVSQFVSLIRDTSLAVVISLPELTHNSKIIYAQYPSTVLVMFIIMTVCYFAICYSLSLFAKRFELNYQK
ncbi:MULTISPECIES: amino acid ABC transporter permease [Enterococcaceae]|uniref:Glutamine ABC transporter permease n=1 Tax=Vagococcus martis TaxID=1768210 RepID=A0A1V4DEI5_9ENTE|nr:MULTISPECIES: amino acid ABC transporter permease [Enterococcaceae]MCI0129880.1 amino acid ABC transporter permease [Vagococcus sp. CY53-2]OPF86716.1 glutamine ABC transporter permease [Vagococcus martis]RGI30754.1 amino acid ABC transporter permease [Melissococcus sp. OM08-11BH]UNM88731.1 amino acid ABC transporter permease [Vagococcus sp. CY52-2]